MSSANEQPELRRQLLPLLATAHWSAVESPKIKADDLMLGMTDRLLTMAPLDAQNFYAEPSGTDAVSNNWYDHVREDFHTLARRYSHRATWLSLEERAPTRLLSGLLTFALAHQETRDWRDLLVSLAPYHHCAQSLDMDIPAFFDRAADYAPPVDAPHYRTFGHRLDVTLGAFGWIITQTPFGPRLRPSYIHQLI